MVAVATTLSILYLLAGHVLLVSLLARRAGLPIERARLFLGPALVRRRIAGVPFELGAVPLGSFVQFPPAEADPERTVLQTAPLSARVSIALAPWLVLWLPSLALLGPLPALEAFATGFVQLPVGGLLFWSEGRAWIAAIAALLETASPHVVAGLVIAKLCAMNLLPFPGLSGGELVAGLPRGVRALLSILLGLTMLGWLIALVTRVVS